MLVPQNQFQIVFRQVADLWFRHEECEVFADVHEKLGVQLLDVELQRDVYRVSFHLGDIKVFYGEQLHGRLLRADH